MVTQYVGEAGAGCDTADFLTVLESIPPTKPQNIPCMHALKQSKLNREIFLYKAVIDQNTLSTATSGKLLQGSSEVLKIKQPNILAVKFVIKSSRMSVVVDCKTCGHREHSSCPEATTLAHGHLDAWVQYCPNTCPCSEYSRNLHGFYWIIMRWLLQKTFG